MKNNRWAMLLAALCLLLLLAVGAGVLAQSSARFNLEWHFVGSGGGQSSSTGYRVNGTIGQSMAGPPEAVGATHSVTGGYWVVDVRSITYLPVVANP